MGSIVFSLDAELAWGFHDLEQPPSARIAKARDGWKHAIDLFEEFDMPATWAIVGHLHLEACDGMHAQHPATREWFSRDPGTDCSQDPEWYAPELVSAICEASVEHELACHSFSHVSFGAPETTPELARAELKASRSAAASNGIRARSFVFPRNHIGHRSILAEEGYRCYRSRWPRPIDHTQFRGPLKIIETALGRQVPIVQARIDEYGLVAIPPSIDVFGFEGVPRRLLGPVIDEPILRRIRRSIETVTAESGIVHLWFHPSDIGDQRGRERIREILERVENCRSDGDLSVETMDSIARRTIEESTD